MNQWMEEKVHNFIDMDMDKSTGCLRGTTKKKKKKIFTFASLPDLIIVIDFMGFG